MKKLITLFIWIAGIILILSLIGYKPLTLVLTNSGNTYYQYTGAYPQAYQNQHSVFDPNTPLQESMYGNQMACYPLAELYQVGIVYSVDQTITNNGHIYKFTTVPSSIVRANSQTSTCGAMAFDTKVLKDGSQIDEIIIPSSVNSCSDFSPYGGSIPTEVERQYDNIDADFGFAYEHYNGGQRCGTFDYVVHKFQILNQTQGNSGGNSNGRNNQSSGGGSNPPIANPNNQNYVPPSSSGWLINFFNSIKQWFIGFFTQ